MLDKIIVWAPSKPHFKGLDMKNLQYEIGAVLKRYLLRGGGRGVKNRKNELTSFMDGHNPHNVKLLRIRLYIDSLDVEVSFPMTISNFLSFPSRISRHEYIFSEESWNLEKTRLVSILLEAKLIVLCCAAMGAGKFSKYLYLSQRLFSMTFYNVFLDFEL